MLGLAFFFFLLALILTALVIAYVYRTKPDVWYETCTVTGDCPFDQNCKDGVCQETTCGTCTGGGICLDGYCAFDLCLYSNQCPASNPACVDGLCRVINQTCKANEDCQGLICQSGKCVQCSSSSQCALGEGCFNGVCRYPTLGENVPNYLTYNSSAHLIGNILAPSAYLCPQASCGSTIQTCSATQPCPQGCGYCVNGECRCVAGQDRELCRANGDCLSQECHPIGDNNYCIPPGGECLNNYQGGNLSCPKNKPYCVEGICSVASLGAVCSGMFDPPNLCADPGVFGLSGTTGIGPFCVDGRCQAYPGQRNQFCTGGGTSSNLNPDSCGYPLTCQSTANGNTCQADVLILD